MKIVTVLITVRDFFNQYILPVHKIPSIEYKDNGWDVIVEVIEEKEYMISHAKEELLGVYSVRLNEELEILAYSRLSLRPRSALIKET